MHNLSTLLDSKGAVPGPGGLMQVPGTTCVVLDVDNVPVNTGTHCTVRYSSGYTARALFLEHYCICVLCTTQRFHFLFSVNTKIGKEKIAVK